MSEVATKKLRERGSSPRKSTGSDSVSVELQKLRVSRIRRVSDPGASDAARESAAAADDDLLTLRLGRLHVASGSGGRSPGAAAGAASCPCGRRCGSPGAPGCRRRRLVLRPARLKPPRRSLLREARLLRPAAAESSSAASASTVPRGVFGGAAPERCSEFSQLGVTAAAVGALPSLPSAGAGASPASPFDGTGSLVFAAAPVFSTPAVTGATATPAEPAPGSPPSTTCSVQHRQRRPASVDELAGLVAQVSIMSSMAEMMYT